MGKNKVAPKNTFKKRDNFFTNSKKSFTKQRPDFHKVAVKNSDFLSKNTSSYKQNSDRNESSSGDFFIKRTDQVKPSNNSNETDKRSNDTATKKPFDKKKWRLQKYSKKYKLQQWEEKRKKAVLREYYKEVKDDAPKFDVKKIYEAAENSVDGKQFFEEDGDVEATENENNLNANMNPPDISDRDQNVENSVADSTPANSKMKKGRAFKKAHLEFQRIKEDKQKKKEDRIKKKAERDEALKAYKQKKVEKYKRLSRTTKRGQPIMKDRMEMLLEQIQKNIN